MPTVSHPVCKFNVQSTDCLAQTTSASTCIAPCSLPELCLSGKVNMLSMHLAMVSFKAAGLRFRS